MRKKINILTNNEGDIFIRQLDRQRFDKEYEFFENSNNDCVWDLLVVYEGLRRPWSGKVRNGSLVFISGEPPLSNVYPKKFLDQFNYIVSSHKNIKHPNNILHQQSLNWHYRRNYSEEQSDFHILKTMGVPKKTRNISVITSRKNRLPGHKKRLSLLQHLQSSFPQDIDMYGKGVKMLDDKAEGLDPYRFHICIENAFIDDYWSEKFADPVLAYSIPIYIGCNNITDYFPEKGYFNFNIDDTLGITEKISEILQEPEVVYDKMLDELRIMRNKILDDYNLFPELIRRFGDAMDKNNSIVDISLHPIGDFLTYKLELLKMRCKRNYLKYRT